VEHAGAEPIFLYYAFHQPHHPQFSGKPTAEAGLPDFFVYNIPKFDKCTKLPQNRTNGCKFFQNNKEIFQMAIKYIKIIHSKAFQKYLNWYFW
jgi:hypothetical protein